MATAGRPEGTKDAGSLAADALIDAQLSDDQIRLDLKLVLEGLAAASRIGETLTVRRQDLRLAATHAEHASYQLRHRDGVPA